MKFCKHRVMDKCDKDDRPCIFSMECYEPEEAKRQTNADRIRAMSDEELAEWIVGLLDDCTQCAGCDRSLCWKEPCMKWLQQPAEE